MTAKAHTASALIRLIVALVLLFNALIPSARVTAALSAEETLAQGVNKPISRKPGRRVIDGRP
jgi:hypothetical protein